MASVQRETICFPQFGTVNTLHSGDAFESELRRFYDEDESEALDAVMQLKAGLRTLPSSCFWEAFTEGLSKLVGADMSFVAKRALVDDNDTAVEMPPLGEPGSCLMAVAIHHHARDGQKMTSKGIKFESYDCPCAYMRHDKVFLIPEKLNEFITRNPNQTPIVAESYLAVPLYSEGKCFAHFGALWSKEAASSRKLSWGITEMLMHALEDIAVQRLLEDSRQPLVVHHEDVSPAQTLQPLARPLSHELRTPLHGVMGTLEAMRSNVEEISRMDPKFERLLHELKGNIEDAMGSSRRAVEAADNVIRSCESDEPRKRRWSEAFPDTDVRKVISNVVDTVLATGCRPESSNVIESENGEVIKVHSTSQDGEPINYTLQWTVSPEASYFPTDEHDLSKIASCLISNGLKFTHDKVTIHASIENNLFLLQVTDNGPGIPQSYLPNLFKPFSQFDASLSRLREGLGLGLTVAQKIAHRCNGNITCLHTSTTDPNRGSTFQLSLPIPNIQKRHSPVRHQARLPLRSTPKAFRQFTILVVEDNRISSKILVSMLKKIFPENAKILAAGSGEAALSLLDAMTQTPTIVLMDLWMPRMDGYETARRIRERGDECRICAVSADNTREARERAREVGMREVLVKPFSKAELRRVVEGLVEG
ncbi:hypothetical protein K470DRAFT_261933 [Piedraia hortae CBS 480.64]|uniref:histidine kinase n=1 Tax=Piedraia hortae CBS 480.64 TaxID=1314780 RepID=A0A6A7C979_9PEZI|nr:hypothetical protein K470DRAFT_261933 [Piedraia hortae CBS 480.64]